MSSSDRRTFLLGLAALPLAACGSLRRDDSDTSGGPAEINRLISHYSRVYDVPEKIIHQTVKRESGYNPAVRNGPYYGLMQIHPQTARTMGFRGDPEELLDAAGVARRSVAAARDIPAGTRITADMLVCRRPATGIAPRDLGLVIGAIAREAISALTVLQWGQLERGDGA